MGRSLLFPSRPSADSAVAAAEADMGVVVVDDRLVVDIGDIGDVDVGHAPIVEKPVALPISTEETYTGVAKAIIDAAIKADVGSPVAVIPRIQAVIPTPIARSP